MFLHKFQQIGEKVMKNKELGLEICDSVEHLDLRVYNKPTNRFRCFNTSSK